MKKSLHIVGYVIILLLITVTISDAQGKLGVVGKIFTKPEAKTLFGKVVGSITVDRKELQQALSKAGDYVLLGVKNNRLIICNEKRQSLGSSANILDKDQPMYIFSTSMVQKLLRPKTAAATQDVNAPSTALATISSAITVEVRAGVLTLSSDTETLEFSMICPPICFD